MAHGPSRSRTSPRRSRRGSTTALILTSAVATASLVLATAASLRSLPVAARTEPLTDSELEAALFRAGLRPEALAAAGLNGNAATALIRRARAELEDSVERLRTASRSRGAARTERDRLVRLVQAGLATEQQVAALGAARADLAAAEAELTSCLDSVRTAALGEVASGEPARALAAIRANASWEVPTQYLVRSATEAEWVALRNALADERSAAQTGGAPLPTTVAVLTAWRADTGVAAAGVNLASLKGPVEAAWRGAINSAGRHPR